MPTSGQKAILKMDEMNTFLRVQAPGHGTLYECQKCGCLVIPGIGVSRHEALHKQLAVLVPPDRPTKRLPQASQTTQATQTTVAEPLTFREIEQIRKQYGPEEQHMCVPRLLATIDELRNSQRDSS